MLLRRRLESAQTADFLKNAFGVQFVFQPLQCAIDRFTFADNHFWHQYHSPRFRNNLQIGEAEPTRRSLFRQIHAQTVLGAPRIGESQQWNEAEVYAEQSANAFWYEISATST